MVGALSVIMSGGVSRHSLLVDLIPVTGTYSATGDLVEKRGYGHVTGTYSATGDIGEKRGFGQGFSHVTSKSEP